MDIVKTPEQTVQDFFHMLCSNKGNMVAIQQLCPSIFNVQQHVMLFDGSDVDRNDSVGNCKIGKTKEMFEYVDVAQFDGKSIDIGLNLNTLIPEVPVYCKTEVNTSKLHHEENLGIKLHDIKTEEQNHETYSFKQSEEMETDSSNRKSSHFAAVFGADCSEIKKEQQSTCISLTGLNIDLGAFLPLISNEVKMKLKKQTSNEQLEESNIISISEIGASMKDVDPLLITEPNLETKCKSEDKSPDVDWVLLNKITGGRQATPYIPPNLYLNDNIKSNDVPMIVPKNNFIVENAIDQAIEVQQTSREDGIENNDKFICVDDSKLPSMENETIHDEKGSECNAELRTKTKTHYPHVQKSKKILGKVGMIENFLVEEEEPIAPVESKSDPFNISNDIYYVKKVKPFNSNIQDILQHATPVVELRPPFVPTYLSETFLRRFHRPFLSNLSTLPRVVKDLRHYIDSKAKERDLIRSSSGGGYVFFMHQPDDLSGRDGEIVLAEFTEEYPPLMSLVGMNSKIKIYYKQQSSQNCLPQNLKYGKLAAIQKSPFLGILKPGDYIQSLENKLYRAPIYKHNAQKTDFLVIQTKDEYWIREYNTVFAVGQECPFYEVPAPKSKNAMVYAQKLLQVFIYRLLNKSTSFPPQISMKDIQKAFPHFAKSSICKHLKRCSKFMRTGLLSGFWVMKQEFRFPSEEEIQAILSPEQCCVYFSMLAAAQRLRDAGYGEKSLFLLDDEEHSQSKMDDEVKTAPWNTTRAYIRAMEGKCLLQINGPADPTGCGQGFSYIRIPNKPITAKQEDLGTSKKLVNGTDADLRRLSLKDARGMLEDLNIPKQETKNLSRWAIIDLLRTISIEKTKAGEEGMDKFCRGNRLSINEHHERYKVECQRIFDLQNRNLASSEVFSTDDNESSASEDFKDFEHSSEKSTNKGNPFEKRILKITRTYKDANGCEFQRVEIVRDPAVIAGYYKIRTTKDKELIKQYAPLDEGKLKMLRREKRLLQEKLRRHKMRQQFCSGGEDKLLPEENVSDLSLVNKKCGACGQFGHMRTKRQCPFYSETVQKLCVVRQRNFTKNRDNKSSNVKEGAKNKQTKEKKITKRPQSPRNLHCDYLERKTKTAKRRCTDPVIFLSSIFEDIINELRRMPEIEPFLSPLVPDYFKIVQHPMDFRTIRERIYEKYYHNCRDFLADVKQIADNSKLYNGVEHHITLSAQIIFNRCKMKLDMRQKEIFALEETSDNVQNEISIVLKNILMKLELGEKFIINSKTNAVIKNSMDLVAMYTAFESRIYISQEDFVKDMKSIVTNCEQNSGFESAIAKEARLILNYAQEALQKINKN